MNIKLLALKFVLGFKRYSCALKIKLRGIKGSPFSIKREGYPSVKAYLYRPTKKSDVPMPLLINVHGGAWVMGDALKLDTQSRIISEELSALVVNVNYKKADQRAFPYAQNEIADTVKYFAKNASSYGIDPQKIILMGYSAGAHLCACASQMLNKTEFNIRCQVLCYPFTDFTCGRGTQTDIKETLDKIEFMNDVLFAKISKEDFLASPGQNPELEGLPAAIVITCGNDPLRIQGDEYAKALQNAGVDVKLFHYEGARHGYMEVNYPETPQDDAKSPEQAKLCEESLARVLLEIKNNIRY